MPPTRHLRPLAPLLVSLVAIAAPVEAGVNLRLALAQLDPDVAASAALGGVTLDAGIESGTGFGLGVEFESRRVAVGLTGFQTRHDVTYDARFFGAPIALGSAARVDLLTALVSVRYRINPDSRFVVSIGLVVGGIGYTDLELPDGDTDDGGTAVLGGEVAVDLSLGRDGGWFVRGAYRLLDGDLDVDGAVDGDLGMDDQIDEQLVGFLDTAFNPTLASVEFGYRF